MVETADCEGIWRCYHGDSTRVGAAQCTSTIHTHSAESSNETQHWAMVTLATGAPAVMQPEYIGTFWAASPKAVESTY